MSLNISTSQLVLAWRKAKVDLYYSTNPPLFEMAEYEENLLENLEQLRKRINGKTQTWVTKEEFLGTWTLAPKSITYHPSATTEDQNDEKAGKDTTLIFAAPDAEWTSQVENGKPPTAEFRLMAQCSIDFHVFSALWMLQVGHHFDKVLDENVYGSRLRRNGQGQINTLAMGSFKPYLKPFRDWRNGAINSMRTALTDKKDVIALTADVTSFYHELNPDFMLDEAFHEKAGIALNEDEARLNRLFIKALQAWAKETPLKKGLPVGLPASAVVANAALIELDQFINKQVVPLYYGRYVDDILLVMHNTSKLDNSKGFWDWVINRDGGNKLLTNNDGKICFHPDYLKNSDIAFENSKNKLFILSGGPGIALINAINEQINLRASEWRALPDLPDSPSTIATDLLKATNNTGEHADNLRKMDALTLHRAGFALRLRDYEAFERDLPPDAWQTHRHAFFDAVIDHLLTPEKYFELAQYLPRVLRMATACEDFDKLGKMIEALQQVIEKVEKHCRITIKSGNDSSVPDKAISCWRDSTWKIMAESVIAAFPAKLIQLDSADLKKLLNADTYHALVSGIWPDILDRPLVPTHKHFQEKYRLLFSHDLAQTPLRFCGLPKELVNQRGIPDRSVLHEASWNAVEYEAIDDAISTLANWFKPKPLAAIPPGLYFPTRPFGLNELYLIAPEPFKNTSLPVLDRVIRALRGFELNEYRMPQWDEKQRTLSIPDGEPRPKQAIAVSSWKTSDQSFVASAMQQPDPDSRSRYQRLNRLINELISRPDNTGYLILPELAVPPQWFLRIASKLNGRRISLISGVGYLHSNEETVQNQIWASLTHDGLGFPSLMLYRQDKQTPAFYEEKELHRLAGVSLQPTESWASPPVIQHGDFHFALLNCSELTNIRYRTALRGKIDALFIAEWNRDIDTFNALVESAALDIHAYIIQCNNRRYGDSRIRAPHKERWQRDLLQVKGGNHDYCITGEIDVLALRQFQSSHRSPNKPFKPVPDGFNQDMAHARKVLPKGGQA